MTKRFDAEQVFDLALESRRGKIEGCERNYRWIFPRNFFGGVHKPVLADISEEIANFKGIFVWSVISDHQHKLRSEVGAEETGQPPRYAPSNLTMQFVAAHNLDVCCPVFEVFCNRCLQFCKVGHLETISPIRFSKAPTGAGMVKPKIISIDNGANKGINQTRPSSSPTFTPSGTDP